MKIATFAGVLALALAGCSQTTTTSTSTAELESFQKLNAEIGYSDARIDHDFGGCAIYLATGPDGKEYREPLRYENGMTICPQ